MIDNKEYCKSTGKFNLHLKSHNLSEEEYVSKYEGGKIPTCQYCGTRHLFDKGTWLWAKTCHIQKCAGSKWQQTWVKKDPKEHGVKSGQWRNDPEKKTKAAKAVHEANLRVGEDGLTGYARTKLKREAILEARTGNKFDAGWDKMRKTWKTATPDHRKKHGAKIKEGVLEKHGVEYIMQVPEILEKQKKTLNRPEERARRSAQMIEQLKTMQLSYSKVSQELGRSLEQKIGSELWFAEGGGEFKVGRYAVDIAYRNKIIEFNGDFWHANPQKYSSHDVLSHFDKHRTAQWLWDRDAKRLEFIKSRGYEVKVVWEADFRKSPEQTIQECVSWLTT